MLHTELPHGRGVVAARAPLLGVEPHPLPDQRRRGAVPAPHGEGHLEAHDQDAVRCEPGGARAERVFFVEGVAGGGGAVAAGVAGRGGVVEGGRRDVPPHVEALHFGGWFVPRSGVGLGVRYGRWDVECRDLVGVRRTMEVVGCLVVRVVCVEKWRYLEVASSVVTVGVVDWFKLGGLECYPGSRASEIWPRLKPRWGPVIQVGYSTAIPFLSSNEYSTYQRSWKLFRLLVVAISPKSQKQLDVC